MSLLNNKSGDDQVKPSLSTRGLDDVNSRSIIRAPNLSTKSSGTVGCKSIPEILKGDDTESGCRDGGRIGIPSSGCEGGYATRAAWCFTPVGRTGNQFNASSPL